MTRRHNPVVLQLQNNIILPAACLPKWWEAAWRVWHACGVWSSASIIESTKQLRLNLFDVGRI